MKDKVKNNQDCEKLNIIAINNSISLPKQRRVMFKFDDDEPVHIASFFEDGEFIITLKDGKIKFENGGKTFELYVE